MAHFDKSKDRPMGAQLPGGLQTSSFADASSQRLTIRLPTRAGPGFYSPHFEDFARFEGPPASPMRRQPLRQLPTSPQLRKSTTRFASSSPQFEPPVMRDHSRFPGPGHCARSKNHPALTSPP